MAEFNDLDKKNYILETEISKRIKKLREKQHLSLYQLAKYVGVGKSTVGKWEKGKISAIRSKNIIALARALNTTPEYLLGWSREIEISNLFKIKVEEFPIISEVFNGEVESSLKRQKIYIKDSDKVDADFCMLVQGDSMTSAKIYDGDIAFIKKQNIVENDELAAVLINSRIVIRKVFIDEEKKILILKAANSKAKSGTMQFSESKLDKVRILGKVTAVMRYLKDKKK